MPLQSRWLGSHPIDDLFGTAGTLLILSENTRMIPEGDFIFCEGDMSDEMYIILSGKVAIMRDGSDQELAELGPLEFLGEMGCLQGERRSANAVAKEATHILVIPETAVYKMIGELSPFVVKLIDVLIDRLREANERLQGKTVYV